MAARFGNEFELVDIQVHLPGGSIDWLEPANGLNLVYGKNGCGKSTLLKALVGKSQFATMFLRAPLDDETLASRTLWRAIVSRFTESLISTDFLQTADSIESWSYIAESVNNLDSSETGEMISNRLTDLGVSELLNSLDVLASEMIAKRDSSTNDLASTPFSSINEIEQHFSEIHEMLLAIRSVISEKRQIPSFLLLEQIHSLYDANSTLRDAIYKGVQLGDIEKFRKATDPSIDGVTAIEGSTRHIAESVWGERHHEILVEKKTLLLRHLLKANRIKDSFEYFGWELEEDDLPLGEMFENQNEIIEVFVNALQSLLSDSQIAFSRSGDLEWTPAFWVRIPEDVSGSPHSDVEKFFRRIRSYLTEIRDGLESVDAHAGAAYMMVLENEPFSNFGGASNKYLLVSPDAESVNLPIQIVDLDAALDLSSVAMNLLRLASQDIDLEVESSVEIGDSHDHTGEDGDGDSKMTVLNPQIVRLLPHGKARVDEMMKVASTMLQGLDIGLRRIHLEMHLDKESLINRRQPEFKFIDSTGSRKWILFDGLSSAQQRWVKILLRTILHAWSPRRFVLFVSDEPDAGVHQGAARQSLEFFVSLPTPSIVASHSPVSFQIDNAHLVHLSSTETGIRRISLPILSEDVGIAARDLGVSTLDLLALKRLLVVCEGDHDVAVVEGLLNLSNDSKIRQRTLVVAARGVRNLLSTPATRIITEYTNLQVLHVADNVNSRKLFTLVEVLKQGALAGLPPNRILRDSGLRDLQRDASPEERVMLGLLEQCVQRRLLDRFHVFGFSKRDIIEYLPASEFGLTDDWARLRTDFENFKSEIRLDFKTWLKAERQASVSTQRVTAAFEKLDALDGDLAALLTEMSVLSAVGALR